VTEVLETLSLSAKSNASILILGESGTGKSVLAKNAHQNSLVADKPFVTVSCPSLSKELLESELFGHVKGAFTGAIKDSWGKVHAAVGGTLFLDEIGELPMEIQPKLLRLLQEKEYERLGENKTRSADVRVIAATNQDLEQCIAVFGLSKEAESALKKYDWGGNLRELRNTIERAVILCRDTEIPPELLPQPGMGGAGMKKDGEESGVFIGGDFSLEEIESAHISKHLETQENLQDVAATLGIDKATLYRKRKKLKA